MKYLGNEIELAHQVDRRERRVSDEVMHYALKGDLVEHNWAQIGMT